MYQELRKELLVLMLKFEIADAKAQRFKEFVDEFNSTTNPEFHRLLNIFIVCPAFLVLKGVSVDDSFLIAWTVMQHETYQKFKHLTTTDVKQLTASGNWQDITGEPK